ncbi:hypothetical protein [Pedobacter hartonius]|uniref:Uncharacterized protein n=1 Tax=Pedobacter hartonius TaxID=425514 RepID=A0A1H3VZV6_9SPHI|nr:hypothetical protein [Pedobacter hartonius]SDZ80211.1 hypothetical protein SAMN05443550_10130 [Pedobacter hartonius]
MFIAVCFTPTASAQTKRDEAAFHDALKSFQSAVLQKNLVKAGNMMHFPLFTSKADPGNGKELPADPIGKQELECYKNDIFNADVGRILPKLGEEALSEIAANEDSYYAALRKATDPGSKMYECYSQYPGRNGGSESFFAFIFGKINNNYKVIAYYGKWPLR